MVRKLTEEDQAAWHDEAKNIKKIPRSVLPVSLDKPINPVNPIFPEAPTKISNARQLTQPALDPLSEGTFAGVDAGTIRRIKRGQLAASARIDLHGMTQEEAYYALVNFVEASVNQNKRLVLIITGKGRVGQGGGVLKTMLPKWLNSDVLRPRILAFDTAHIQHGGTGAFYVLLKRKRL